MLRRLLALLLVAAGIVAIFLNPLQLSLSVGERPVAIDVVTAPRDLQLVCPGALYQAGGASGTSLTATRLGAANLVGHFAQVPMLTLLKKTLLKGETDQPGPVAGSTQESVSVTAHDQGAGAAQSSAMLQVMQYQLARATNLAGLAAANCVRPAADSWLVGGDTSPGRETLLVMANPSPVDSTVNLELLGSGGPVEAPGLSSISVPASQTTVVAISSVAPNLATFAVHVVASGGAIGAWLETRTVRGLTAGGVDFIGPAIAASKTLSIPGVFLRGSTASARLQALGETYSDLQPVLRIANTSKRVASVTAQLVSATSGAFGTVLQQDVAANSVVDVPITGLQDGDYAALLRSDAPVRAAVRFARVKDKQTDFAWAQASAPSLGPIGFSAPAGAVTKLSLVNASRKSANISVGGTKVALSANSALTITVAPGASQLISADGVVSASTVIDVAGNVSVLPVIDYRNLGGSLKILVR